MTWQPVADVLDHVRVVNPNSRGCRDCGTIENCITDHGYRAYYPGVECCPPALKRQITWRMQEIDALRKRLQERQDRVTELNQRIDHTTTKASRAAAEAEADRANRNLHKTINEHFTPQLRELSDEISRLRTKLRKLEPGPA